MTTTKDLFATNDFFNDVKILNYQDGKNFPVEQEDKTVHEFVLFNYKDRNYLLSYAGFLLDLKTMKQIVTSAAKNNTYEKYTIQGVQVYAHHLVLLTCKFKVGTNRVSYRVYRNLNAGTNKVVNHIFTVADQKGKLIPYPKASKNALYLEVIANKENLWHGHFIKKWNLYGLPLTYKQCITLESYMMNTGYNTKTDKAKAWSLAKRLIQGINYTI